MSRVRNPKKKDNLSEEEVWDVLKFSNFLSSNYGTYFTPDAVNQRMKEISMQPISATAEDIDKALLAPNSNEELLKAYSQNFELSDILYKRLIRFYADMLGFDFTYECVNASPEDYKKPQYIKDELILEDFTNRFNFKKQFDIVNRQLFRKETFFCVLRDDGEQFSLQELPEKYCKITGRWDNGILFDFNMQWFIANYGVDINMYPPIFKKYYRRIFDNKTKPYNPSSPINKRDSEFIFWTQTSPVDGFWCFKLTPEITTQVPFFAPLFPELVSKPVIRKLQTDAYIIEASKLLVGIIGFNKDSKSGAVKNAINISPEVAGKFAGVVRQGLSKQIQFAMLPTESATAIDFDTNERSMLDQYNKTTIGSSGSNARLLYSTDKLNAEESRASLSVDEQLAMSMYSYFEDFVNYHINRRTKKFKFKIKFEGTQFPSNRDTRKKSAMELAAVGIVLPQKIAASIGMSPFALERQLDMAKSKGFTDKLMPLMSAFQQSSKGGKGGRPEDDDSTNDSTIASKDRASNAEKTGS